MPSEPTVEMRSATVGDAAFIVEMAVIAEDETGEAGPWAFHHEPPLLVDAEADSVLEIAIAVSPERRGSNLGGSLLDKLFVRCTDRYAALNVNVHKRNPASRLYERKGFRVLGQGRGTLGIAMRKELW